MKKFLFMAFAATICCGIFASCNTDDDDEIYDPFEITDGDKKDYYGYSEEGFFIDGEIKVVGFFDKDSVIEGYTKYVERNYLYHEKDNDEEEHKRSLGYGMNMRLKDFAVIYTDEITYNADSTRITGKGHLYFIENDEKNVTVPKVLPDNKKNDFGTDVSATIDEKGQPHLITCKTVIDDKQVTIQFRELHFRSPYDAPDIEIPKDDEFSI